MFPMNQSPLKLRVILFSASLYLAPAWSQALAAFTFKSDRNYQVEIELYSEQSNSNIWVSMDSSHINSQDSLSLPHNSHALEHLRYIQLAEGTYQVKSIRLSHRQKNEVHTMLGSMEKFQMKDGVVTYLGQIRARLLPNVFPKRVEFGTYDNFDHRPADNSQFKWNKSLIDLK